LFQQNLFNANEEIRMVVHPASTQHVAPQVHHNASQPKQQAQNNDNNNKVQAPKNDDTGHKVNIKA
jgi:hypothetical protein